MEKTLELIGSLSEASIAVLALLVALGVIGLAAYCVRVIDRRGSKDG